MMAHTPKPWKLCDDFIVGPDGDDICEISVREVYRLKEGKDNSEMSANGTLIEAAPELLEALEAFVREHDCEASAFEDDSLCECKLCIPARAAIAKARGW